VRCNGPGGKVACGVNLKVGLGGPPAPQVVSSRNHIGFASDRGMDRPAVARSGVLLANNEFTAMSGQVLQALPGGLGPGVLRAARARPFRRFHKGLSFFLISSPKNQNTLLDKGYSDHHTRTCIV
jgi:hypothetical protein